MPYKGSAPAIVDTIGGNTQFMSPSLFTAYPQIKGGKLKALGIAGEKRAAVLPDVPTLAEQGAEVETGTPEQLKTLVQKETLHWKSVVTAAKIKAE